MAHTQKSGFVFRRNGRVHLNWQGHQFSRQLVAEACASAVVMLDTPSFEVVKGTGYPLHSPFSLHFPSRASPCAITFQLDSTTLTPALNAEHIHSLVCSILEKSSKNGVPFKSTALCSEHAIWQSLEGLFYAAQSHFAYKRACACAFFCSFVAHFPFLSKFCVFFITFFWWLV